MYIRLNVCVPSGTSPTLTENANVGEVAVIVIPVSKVGKPAEAAKQSLRIMVALSKTRHSTALIIYQPLNLLL